MLYSLAEVAKATNLPEQTFLSAIERGQITGIKDLLGKWHVEDTELRRLCSLIIEHNANKDAVRDHARPDSSSLEAEIAALVTEVRDCLREQPSDRSGHCHLHTGDDEAPNLNLFADANYAALRSPGSLTTSIWDHDLRMDDRDKILVSPSPPFFRRFRIAAKTGVLITALIVGGIGGLSCYFLSFRSNSTPKQKVNSSAPVPGSENQAARVPEAPPKVIREILNTGKSATAAGTGIAHPNKSTLSSDRILTGPTKASAVEQQSRIFSDTASAATTRSTKTFSKPVPAPETRPATIEGWKVHNVVDARQY